MKSEKREDAVQAASTKALRAFERLIDVGRLEENGEHEESIRALREAIERLRDLASTRREKKRHSAPQHRFLVEPYE